ncbi:hypothetical protein AZ22_4594 [Bordetella bronchiseptica 980-2]|nr:hypothetical protein AZ22_4594 [Bordetella bronchiseptica 980-2]KCV57392.1 hypothetical protein AZ14_4566 [Bordetella bronchiseptica 980]KDB98513.1 hypothetical protein AZ23_4557 [Bordetella bronchiseptica E010]KDB99649.1 hypothetical protein AZ18_4653 [Bordetella bronchiseptica D993]KDC43067.1 hypothetical protein L509_4496 [Bordetella bronchiseptica M85/00/2]KDC43679.1 hypothetical protein L508_4484 [Bordetella bronchiseptica M435/02/3]KDC73475.1 hypothetical protein L512_4549 [Bordetell
MPACPLCLDCSVFCKVCRAGPNRGLSSRSRGGAAARTRGAQKHVPIPFFPILRHGAGRRRRHGDGGRVV